MKKVFLIFGMGIILSGTLIALAITGGNTEDPVCGMNLNAADAAARLEGDNGILYFCSDHCKKAFCANPTAYLDQAKLDKIGIKFDEPETGCAGCIEDIPTEPEGCDGNCGQTEVSAINEFHKVMHPIEIAVNNNDLETVKARYSGLIQKKEAVMIADRPDGIYPSKFDKARKDFSGKVDAFILACKSDDFSTIKKTFDEMHKTYEVLDQMAR